MSTDNTVGPSSTNTSKLPQIIKTVSAEFGVDTQTAIKIHNFYYNLTKGWGSLRCAVCLASSSIHSVRRCEDCYYLQCALCNDKYGGCWRAKLDETH
jgi:hypothetical protein